MATLTRKRTIRIGPDDNGRRMSLADFNRAIAQPGYLYELGNGVIEVSQIPSFEHARVQEFLRDEIAYYKRAKPGVVSFVATGDASKTLVESTESERHPDLSIYCSEHPGLSQPWDLWVPEIVVEIVSESSRKRDYEAKPDEYLAFGVKEYWLIDPAKQVMVAHNRVGGLFQKRTLRANQKYKTHLLPTFVLEVGKVLSAGKR